MFDQQPYEEERAPLTVASRLLFLTFPDLDASARMASVARDLRVEHQLSGKTDATGRFHITLQHIGDYPALPYDVVEAAMEAASAIAMPSFTVTFDTASSFRSRGPHPLVLRGNHGVAGLLSLQQRLGAAMERIGLGPARRQSLTPHVTLLRDARSIDEQPIEPVTWTVRKFVLGYRLLGHSQYGPLRRWRLGEQR